MQAIPQENVPNLGSVFAALADPSRRRVITTLAADRDDTEHACGSFDLLVGKATRTHHFKVLREAGLIEQHFHGNGSTVRLRRYHIDSKWPGLLDLLGADQGMDGSGPSTSCDDHSG
jgi:DNA-binding transcriptional ArsR family regulator